jgi:hypothetical protein
VLWEPQATPEEVYDAGMRVRREVLGDAHVDRATASADEFTAEVQEMITRYAGARSGPVAVWIGARVP